MTARPTVAVGQRIAEMPPYALHLKFPAVRPKTIRAPGATTGSTQSQLTAISEMCECMPVDPA
ncbi:hypothetical protein, partial [Stenotrophomonas maltophilia]|uniref:hypothetical protein n=1 Tax=Stenotrophomonas maltophilia TaxID=40324 RepID=UPI00195311E3